MGNRKRPYSKGNLKGPYVMGISEIHHTKGFLRSPYYCGELDDFRAKNHDSGTYIATR